MATGGRKVFALIIKISKGVVQFVIGKKYNEIDPVSREETMQDTDEVI